MKLNTEYTAQSAGGKVTLENLQSTLANLRPINLLRAEDLDNPEPLYTEELYIIIRRNGEIIHETTAKAYITASRMITLDNEFTAAWGDEIEIDGKTYILRPST